MKGMLPGIPEEDAGGSCGWTSAVCTSTIVLHWKVPSGFLYTLLSFVICHPDETEEVIQK